MKRVLAISIMALLSTALFVPTAEASVVEPISHVTFSGSFQLPGMTLPGARIRSHAWPQTSSWCGVEIT